VAKEDVLAFWSNFCGNYDFVYLELYGKKSRKCNNAKGSGHRFISMPFMKEKYKD